MEKSAAVTVDLIDFAWPVPPSIWPGQGVPIGNPPESFDRDPGT